ncbi:putative N-acyl homoserine lactonase AttM [Rhizodiscina lignyota]|uniref:N-acyl homoserine lactonase AttM n=1 Tax=Rhizodiscina lignyota TaxID=1504668 RepID=A0A9P4IJ67_9PEZI|nr:putative N-acyl homoserine lactonase AttM [Rhizodiscina lignyota]
MVVTLKSLAAQIPESESCVQICIIDTTTRIEGFPHSLILDPDIPGWETPPISVYALLIEHASGRKLLYDLGLRKDWENLPPRISGMLHQLSVTVEKDVPEILKEDGLEPGDIEAIIPSHWHFEHMGDPSLYPSSTAMLVGPGFKKEMMPGYPCNPDGNLLESDFAGREVRELDFSNALDIAQFKAIDYFGDGSFYLLDTPGHAVGHLGALARTSTEPSTFILMIGDCVHHPGQLRPSSKRPLPDSIVPNPLNPTSSMPCLGALFQAVHPKQSRTEPFFHISDPPKIPMANYDIPDAKATIAKIMENDAFDEIFVVMAHDASLRGIVEFFPKTANEWRKQGWGRKARWAFLKEFRNIVD